MPRRTFVAMALAGIGVVACVDVPDTMRAQFAPAGPNERTNYRPGPHGTAPPIEDGPNVSDAGAEGGSV